MGKWVSVRHSCVPTYGKDGEEFVLFLRYQDYYGHSMSQKTEFVVAIWDSINEMFIEKQTRKFIAPEDIDEWYMEDENGNV